MPRRPERTAALLLLAGVIALATPAAAQRSGVARAFDLERRGSYAQAVEAYTGVLRQNPGDVTALLGMERALTPLSRTPEILPFVTAALQRDSTTGAIYAIGVRAWAAAGQQDSLEVLVQRWAAQHPDEETPYREWGRALLRDHDRGGARQAYLRGRQALGEPSALAAELALLATTEEDYPEAAREWALAAARLPGYRASALNSLGQTPEGRRDDVLRQLHQDTLLVARRLEAELLARWGEPERAYALFAETLPPDRVQAVQVIRQFLEQLRAQRSPSVRRVQGMAYEDIANLSSGPQASRMRLEAARAYAEGGDQTAARRMLATLAGDPQAPSDLAAGATATLIEVLVAEGDVEEAERRLAEFQEGLGGEERLRLRRDVAWGWIGQGDLDRAAHLVASDSTVDGLALAGYVALYRGQLRQAGELFKQAGPYAGTREDAAARTSLVALMQPIEAETIPELGAALLTLRRGDTTTAMRDLGNLAPRLPPTGGRGELYHLMGSLSVATRDVDGAEQWFRAAAETGSPGAAPAAELALGRLLLDLGRRGEAAEVLEHMIITYGDSALVPQARRLLDQARGGVPSI